MWKRQTLQMLKLSLLKSSKTYQVFGTELLKSKGKLQKFIIPFKKPTVIISHNFSTKGDSAKALFELGKDNEAFSSIKKELSLNPRNHDLHRILIDKLKEKHRLEDLESFYKEVIEMIEDPESVSDFYLTSTDTLVRHEMFPKALLAYREAIKNDLPMDYCLHYRYGELLQHEGFYEEALVQFEQFEKGPNSDEDVCFSWYAKEARIGAAYVNYCLGRVRKAKEEFEKIISEDELERDLTTWKYVLVLYHLDEIVYSDVEDKFREYFDPFFGDKWIRFFEQESKVTQGILERGDIDEETRKFNATKLRVLNVLLPIIRKRIKEEKEQQNSPGYWY